MGQGLRDRFALSLKKENGYNKTATGAYQTPAAADFTSFKYRGELFGNTPKIWDDRGFTKGAFGISETIPISFSGRGQLDYPLMTEIAAHLFKYGLFTPAAGTAGTGADIGAFTHTFNPASGTAFADCASGQVLARMDDGLYQIGGVKAASLSIETNPEDICIIKGELVSAGQRNLLTTDYFNTLPIPLVSEPALGFAEFGMTFNGVAFQDQIRRAVYSQRNTFDEASGRTPGSKYLTNLEKTQHEIALDFDYLLSSTSFGALTTYGAMPAGYSGSATIQNLRDTQAPVPVVLSWTGGLIVPGGALKYKLQITIPKLKIMDAQIAGGDGRKIETVRAVATIDPASKQDVQIQIINATSTYAGTLA